MMKRLFWLSLMVFSMTLVAAAQTTHLPLILILAQLHTPASAIRPQTHLRPTAATNTPAAPKPGATSTPVCAPNCLRTSVELMRVETRAEPTLMLFGWLVLAAALVMSVCRWGKPPIIVPKG